MDFLQLHPSRAMVAAWKIGRDRNTHMETMRGSSDDRCQSGGLGFETCDSRAPRARGADFVTMRRSTPQALSAARKKRRNEREISASQASIRAEGLTHQNGYAMHSRLCRPNVSLPHSPPKHPRSYQPYPFYRVLPESHHSPLIYSPGLLLDC